MSTEYEYRVICEPTGAWHWGSALRPTRDETEARKSLTRANDPGGCGSTLFDRHAHYLEWRPVGDWERAPDPPEPERPTVYEWFAEDGTLLYQLLVAPGLCPTVPMEVDMVAARMVVTYGTRHR